MVQAENEIRLYSDTVLPIFQKHGMDYFLDDAFVDERFFQTPSSSPVNFGVTVFDADLDTFRSEMDSDELPFFVAAKCVFTNKGVHVLIKKLFNKKYLFFPWNNAMQFEFKITSLSMIDVYVNGEKTIQIMPNLQRLGMSQDDVWNMSTKKLPELFQPDIQNLTNAFGELQQVLGK